MAGNSKRDEDIVALIDTGTVTFDAVALKYDITRQRVYQIWVKAGGKPENRSNITPVGYDDLKTFCQKYAYTESRARVQFASNRLNGIKMRGKLFVSTEEPFVKMCVICGDPIIVITYGLGGS